MAATVDNAVVLDCGSREIKAGYANPEKEPPVVRVASDHPSQQLTGDKSAAVV